MRKKNKVLIKRQRRSNGKVVSFAAVMLKVAALAQWSKGKELNVIDSLKIVTSLIVWFAGIICWNNDNHEAGMWLLLLATWCKA